jgi:nickel-dependent lactate racemase
MRIQIPYDGATVELDFPANTAVLEAPEPVLMSEAEVRRRIFSALEDFRKSVVGERVSVVVNDATRRLPTARILRMLLETIPLEAIEILVATGSHRRPNDSELDIIFGDQRTRLNGRIFIHDCYDGGSLIDIGRTSRGTPVTINRKLQEATALVCINSVEPHFFAGYTGGRKSLIPGLAGFDTIAANHSHAKHEKAKSLCLSSNPVHLDLEEAVGLVEEKAIFSIQLVTSRRGEIIDACCGGLRDSFERACRSARGVYAIAIEKKYDIVFAVGEPPLDINLYQLQKGQEHGAEAVAEGGILIVVGACPEGAGSGYFLNLAEEYHSPELALSSKALADNRFGIHKLVKTARRLQTMSVWYVTKVDDNVIRKVYYDPKRTLHEALSDALGLLGPNVRIAILKDACFTVPRLIDS